MNEPVFDQIEPVRNSQHEMAHLKSIPLRCMGPTNGDLTMIQLTLDLQPKREVIWRVQIGRYTKGAYKTRCSMTNAAQAIRYYHCINIGRGYKKRLVKLEGGKAVTIARQTS